MNKANNYYTANVFVKIVICIFFISLFFSLDCFASHFSPIFTNHSCAKNNSFHLKLKSHKVASLTFKADVEIVD